MRNVKVVIGANFGDEGKGLMTDYFCSAFPSDKPVLNVRFNGGAQAGHTVVMPDGRRHVFQHFGAGSFLPNVTTYLSEDFIVNPILFRREYEVLKRLGIYPNVIVHPRCLLTIPQDMMINQMLERKRGNDRHGSCGVGIMETQLRSICIGSFDAGAAHFDIHKLNDLDYVKERFSWKYELTKQDMELLANQNITAHYLDDVRFFRDHCVISGSKIFDWFENVVFEGAQGLMLDQNNKEYYPHLTPSNTGTKNVVKYLTGDMNIEVCYVTRPYLTRHGAGKLPRECSRQDVHAGIDQTNHRNEFQGDFRYGYFDKKEFWKRIDKDFIDNVIYIATRSIALTHADETDDEEFFDGMPSNQTYISTGPKRNDVQML